MSDSKVDLELSLSKRMAGEVYPELLLFMEKTKVPTVLIRIVSKGDDNNDEKDNSIKFSISSKGIIRDVAYDTQYNEIDEWEEDTFEHLEEETNEQLVNYLIRIGEADDDNDEYVPKEFDIQNIDECPIYANYCDAIDYPHYCEKVLDAIEHLFQRDRRIQSVNERINRIPYRKFVITEKFKKAN